LGAGGKVFPRKPYEQIGPQDILFGTTETALITMEFMKELCKYTPPGATSYSWGEQRSAYYGEEVAMTFYLGRVFAETYRYNPKLCDVTGVFELPTPKGRPARVTTWGGTAGWCVTKNAKNMDLVKEFAKSLVTGDLFIQILHSVPMHLAPLRYSVQQSDAFWDHPVYKKYPDILREYLSIWDHYAAPFTEYRDYPNPAVTSAMAKLTFTDAVQAFVLKNAPADKAFQHIINGLKKELK
jgi:ABC-type glycerol-3-phosphate transport system substrate-binding protein